MTKSSSDPYRFWQLALDGVEIGGPSLPIHADKPQPGFYRTKKAGHYLPVAIFEDAGRIVALVEHEEHDVNDLWLRCCTQPVTEAAYRAALASGTWDDVHSAVGFSLATAQPERDRLTKTLAALYAEAKEFAGLGIASDIAAEQGQSLRARILELAREADTIREIEKRPHLEAGKRIDAAWSPIIKDARTAARDVAEAISAYLTKRAAEQKANAPEPATVKGGYGRAASVREEQVIVRVPDWAKLFAHYATDERAQNAILLIAQRDLSHGRDVPHVEIETRKAIR
jgi:hypothetical protein